MGTPLYYAIFTLQSVPITIFLNFKHLYNQVFTVKTIGPVTYKIKMDILQTKMICF